MHTYAPTLPNIIEAACAAGQDRMAVSRSPDATRPAALFIVLLSQAARAEVGSVVVAHLGNPVTHLFTAPMDQPVHSSFDWLTAHGLECCAGKYQSEIQVNKGRQNGRGTIDILTIAIVGPRALTIAPHLNSVRCWTQFA